MMMAASRIGYKGDVCLETKDSKEVVTNEGVLSTNGCDSDEYVQSWKGLGSLDDCSKQQNDSHQVLPNETRNCVNRTIEVGSICETTKICKSSQQTECSSKKGTQGKKNVKRMCANLSGTKYGIGKFQNYHLIFMFFPNDN